MPSIKAAGVNVNFPFDPYPCQVTYMEKVITCLKEVICFMKWLGIGCSLVVKGLKVMKIRLDIVWKVLSHIALSSFMA